uniref:Tetraspanin n=1 Tax=Cyprinodon variegatus TaxID=28743 RepID=A0A3Q2CJW1_CYPVA
MGVDGCTKVIKYVLFLLNFLFWLVGGLILGVALWLRHDHQISSLMEVQLNGTQPPTSFYTSVHILIAVGAVMMVVGFLGCYGAIQESQCLLGTFFVCLVILFACEVAGGIWGYMNREAVSGRPKVFTPTEQQISVLLGVNQAFMFQLQCCGKDTTTSLSLILTSVTCFLLQSCHQKINELFSEKIYLVGIVALVVAVIMIFEMIFSMVLCCGIRNSPVY